MDDEPKPFARDEHLAEEWPRLLGIRGWRVVLKKEDNGRLTPYLRSVVAQHCLWKTNTIIADKIPTSSNHNGIHAILVVADIFGVDEERRDMWLRDVIYAPCFYLSVAGVVDMYGQVVVHADGVARAERARILLLHRSDCTARP